MWNKYLITRQISTKKIYIVTKYENYKLSMQSIFDTLLCIVWAKIEYVST